MDHEPSLARLRGLQDDEQGVAGLHNDYEEEHDRREMEGRREDPTNTTIVEAVVSLAHSLRLEVTGERVETAEQLEHLRRIGCDLVQGHYLAKALPSEEVELLLTDRQVY